MTTAGVRTAVLRPVPRAGLRQRLLAAVPYPPSFLQGPVPSTAMFAAATVLLAGGALPVVDGELVLAGLTTAFLATLVARLVPRSAAAADGTTMVPLAHLAAVALLSAGTGAPGVLFLLLGPVLSLSAAAGRRGVLLAALGTAGVLALPGALTSGVSATDVLPGSLLLGPLAVALGGLAVNETTRTLGARATEIDGLHEQRRALLAQVQSRADELDLATRMLAARAQTMTSVIDAVTEQSIIGTDRDGVIRVWNPGAEKMLGLPRPEVVRKRSIVEFHLPEELAAEAEHHDIATGPATGLAALVHAAQEHGSDVRDWTYVGAHGPRTVSVAVTPRTDDRGVHAGWNFVGTDMTEARATERMKDQFVSLISHELRTPLTSILGYLELVLDDEDQPLTDEQRTYLKTVERNADRLLRLVGDLLFTAQVDAGRFSLEPHDVDLAGVVRSAEESVRVTAATAGVEVVIDVPGDGLVIQGDAVRLGQACDNLVSNAVKFTPSGGRVTLSLRAAWADADGVVSDDERPGSTPVARLAVSDTGMGIPTGEQGKLFTRFFRSSTAQRNAVPGVGLGLAITKAITTAHGGTLDVASAEGEGTTFTLTLPRAAG
jgi:signal transduction histidine kinase